MIKSMTGFGRGEFSDGKRNVTVEIRTVNHRYCDIAVRMPRRYSFAEDKVRKTIRGKISRGKADVSILVENITESDVTIRLNEPVADQYIENLNRLKNEFRLDGEISLSLIAQMPEVLKQIPDVEDEDEMTRCILTPVMQAVENLEEMRAAEGRKLAQDLLMRADLIRELVSRIEVKADDVPREYAKRLRDRIGELLEGSVEIPEDRIMVEAAIFADKCNITEELTRLKSHMDQMKTIITESSGADGKKLDFLVQEMNREANTIGSKANNLEITSLMLQIKAEIEKIREQVQNIE
ncbi:YicC/YloC family endoribonuclease [Hornefia butyriciproducens]|uniref:YicC family protein n=1 Tax=Hornefia butyriciproducens TaxID=2652293 RepID=A0A6L5Y4N2_9FIRM|nr:YicC/YloC family endoribonuclease [Hornefia butyriciproducens]MCI7413374.1 YicC family protein [Clostridiales bacterium]MDD6299003.1 YicC family protein [Hornefia butyriciproducens]MDY5423408.1 YicC/YloC family endoribonuclease [Hornefia butyriciproducens]MDY6212553.1 YicC/YloC family endoribonuclease [Hornefia butyriciproducens]MST51669.1 YicC family protein [Hornefia butyriciproducens]